MGLSDFVSTQNTDTTFGLIDRLSELYTVVLVNGSLTFVHRDTALGIGVG